MKDKSLFISLVAVLLSLVLANNAWAGGDSGFYIGAGLGKSSIEDKVKLPNNTSEFDIDDDDSAYKIFIGYNIGIVPSLDLAVEGGYVNFGSPKGVSKGQNIKYELTGVDAFGLVGATFGPIGLFGKVGMIAWDADKEIGSITLREDSTDFACGLGIRFQVLSASIRGEFERFYINDIDSVKMFSLSAAYTF